MKEAFLTEYGCLSPLGLNKEDFRRNLREGALCIQEMPKGFLPESIPVKFIGQIPNQILDSKRSTTLNDNVKEQRELWLKLLFDSFSERSESPFTTIIFVHNLGANITNYSHWLDHRRQTMWGQDGLLFLTQFNVIERLPRSEKTQIISFHNTCASVSSAVAYAMKRIKIGLDKKVIIVGLETSNSYWPGYITLSALGVLNTKANSTKEAIVPFSSNRAGFVKADGLGYLILETEESMRESQRIPYCEVVGQGMTADSNSLTDGVEDGSIVAKTMESAIREANIQLEMVDYINAHGTGTFLNDLIEVRAIKRLFKEHAHKLYVSSTKSQYGHALCASGLVEISAVLEMFRGEFLGANLGIDGLDTECNLNFVKAPLLNKKIKYAVKNSFGFGGYNASLVMKNCG